MPFSVALHARSLEVGLHTRSLYVGAYKVALYGMLDCIHPRYMVCLIAYTLAIDRHRDMLGMGRWRKMQIRLPHREERGRSG
jgi:hypothetical protein